jgi:hypothetical protein
MLQIFGSFDKGQHFDHPNVPIPPHDNFLTQITYEKVKSFKLLPGVQHYGIDHELLHPNAPPTETPRIPVKRNNVHLKKFRDKFVISVDGERFDPGNGIICEIHEGLATFIADSKLQKYHPSVLYQPSQEDETTNDIHPLWDTENIFSNNAIWSGYMEYEYSSMWAQEGMTVFSSDEDDTEEEPYPQEQAYPQEEPYPQDVEGGFFNAAFALGSGYPFEESPSPPDLSPIFGPGRFRARGVVRGRVHGRGRGHGRGNTTVPSSPSAPIQMDEPEIYN